MTRPRRSTAGVLLAALLCAPAAASAESAAEAFRALTERELAWHFAEHPIDATYAGRSEGNDRLGSVTDEAQQARLKHWDETLAALDRIDVAALPPADRINLRIFRDQVAARAETVRHGAHLMPMNSDSAFYSEIAQLPRVQPLATVADYRRYIARLNDLPRWLAEHTALLELGLERGITVPRVVLQGRDAALAAYAEPKTVEDSVFYAPFAKLPDAIPPEDARSLREDGARAIREHVLPAYAKLRAFLAERYIPGARTTIAAYDLPQGRSWYASQIREYTTLALEPKAIHERGLAEVARIRAEMETIVREVGHEGDFASFLAKLRTDPRFYAKSDTELLMHAAWIAKRVDGALPKFFGTLPRRPFGIAPVPAAIAPYYTAGRYAGAPYGSDEPGYYWVNTTKLESRPLYALPALTLHEAVPGHHLQVALAAEQGEQPLYRRLGYISAFGEGWALYAEKLGTEMGIYQTPYEHFGRLTYEMWRACRLVVDTGIHAFGWSRDRALAFMRDNTA
ncbi:MAG TPA: DUF885 domain-containing protein, partial [Xanthomonadales bacterium]|nr:DUF885 domain-containing protein [Xanthomonadales bacterium]